MDGIATIGHNNPPVDAMEAIQAEYDDTFSEVANWLDGSVVENVNQMKAVDELIGFIKDAKTKAEAAKETEYRPHKDACDGVVVRWKGFLADLDRQRSGLTAAVDAFKRKLAAEKEAIRKAAADAAWEATRKAHEAMRAAAPTDLEAQREADAAKEAAETLQRQANAAKRDTVKGLRTHTEYVVIDPTAFARWLWVNDKNALATFMNDYAQRNKTEIAGIVEKNSERRAA